MSTPAVYVAWKHFHPGEELPPTMGVSEPRRPLPPTLSPGVALPEPVREADGPRKDPRVTFVVSR